MYGFFLLALVVNGWASQYPALLVASVSLPTADAWIARLVERRRTSAWARSEGGPARATASVTVQER